MKSVLEDSRFYDPCPELLVLIWCVFNDVRIKGHPYADLSTTDLYLQQMNTNTMQSEVQL
jgi:hypothetical protein